jgi:hypothetical protein
LNVIHDLLYNFINMNKKDKLSLIAKSKNITKVKEEY